MFDERDRKWLYEQMQQAGVNTGTYDDFKASLNDDTDRAWYYDKSIELGLNVGNSDEFTQMMTEPQTQQPTAATQPTAQQPTQRNMGTPGYVPNRFGIPTQQGMGPVADAAPHPMTPAQMQGQQYVTQQGQGETYTPSARVQTPTAKRPKPMAPAPRAGQWSGAPMQQTPYAPTEDEGNLSFMPIDQGEDTKARYDAERRAVGGQGGQVQSLRESIIKDIEGEQAKVQRVYNPTTRMYTDTEGKPMGIATDNMDDMATSNIRMMDLQAAKRSLDNSQKMIDEANAASRNGNFFAGAGRGMRDKFFDVSTWDFGITDLTDQAAIMRALEAYDNGEHLTESQQALLDAKAVELATTAYFGSEVGRGYKAGQVTAEAIPFMFEMAINPAAGVGKGASKAMVRYALKKFGKEAIEKGGKRYIAKQAMKYGTRIVGDVVGASGMTATTGAARTAADALDRMAGNLHYDTDEQGNITFDGHTDAESWVKAFGKAFASTTIENYSEMLGNYFGPALGLLGKGASKVGKGIARTKAGAVVGRGIDKIGGAIETAYNSTLSKKIGLQAVGDFISKVPAGKVAGFLSELEKRAQWHGVMGEYAEEIAGGLLNALVVGDQTLDTDKDTGVFNLDNNIDTFLGVALMGGFFSGARTVGYGVEKAHNARQYNKANRMGAAAFGDGWADVQAAIDSDPKAGAVAVLSDPNATREQREAALRYAAAVTARQGMEQGKAKRDAEGIQTMQEAAAEQSYNTGYDDANTDELRSDINMAYTDSRQTLVGMIGEDAVNEIDNDPLAMQAQYDQDMTVDDNTKSAIADYVSAKSAWDGVQQRINDDAADRADQRRAEGEKMAYKGKGDMQGMLRPLTINEESSERDPETGKRKKKTVYLVNGNIAIEPNGNGLSREGTDKTIYVYDPETGEAHELDPFAGAGVLEVGEPVSMDDYLSQNEQQSQAEVQQAAETAQGKVKVNTPFETPQGRKGVVQSIEGDNAIVLFADGEMEQASMPLAEVQQYADALRRQEYEARHPQESGANGLNGANGEQAPTAAGQTPTATAETPTEGGNTTAEQPQVEYPRDKQGNIDYDKIGDATTFATALGEEFGEDAPAMLDDIIAEETAKMEKQNAVGKARIRKRLAMLEEAKAQLTPTEEAPAEAPTAEVEQPAQQTEGIEQPTAQTEAPDMSVDKASDARARGYRMQSGVRYDRQGATEGVVGSETEVKFTNKEKPVKGRWKVVEAGSVQPSHIGGQNNPLHFITEAQPKDRTDKVSDAESDKIAANINPKEIIDGITAYTGAPVVNSRGEVIQGNNRATALRKMGGYAESAARYKQYLIDHAADYGLNAEDIAKMQNPVMVREVDVTDKEAIRLGQFTASDTESGGKERISADKVLGKLTDEQTASVLNIMLRGGEETDETLMQLIDRNGGDVLTYLAGQGAINDTQVLSAYGRDGRMTPEAKNDLADLVTQNIFKGGADNIKKVWNEYMPVAAQKALLQAMAGDIRLPVEDRLIKEVRNAIMAVGEIKNNPFTKDAKTAEEYHKGLDMDARQADMLSRPIKERYSELEIDMAVRFLTTKQNALKAIFGEYQRYVTGTNSNLFEEAQKMSRAEAVEKTFGIKENNQQNVTGKETETLENGGGERGEKLGHGERPPEGEPGGAAAGQPGAAEQAGEQPAVSKYEEAESAFFGFLEWTNWEYGTNYDWNSLMSFIKWANKKAKAKEQPLRKFVREWIGDKYPPKDAAELTGKIFAALKERGEAKKATAQQPKEEAEGGTGTAPQPVGGATAQTETPAAGQTEGTAEQSAINPNYKPKSERELLEQEKRELEDNLVKYRKGLDDNDPMEVTNHKWYRNQIKITEDRLAEIDKRLTELNIKAGKQPKQEPKAEKEEATEQPNTAEQPTITTEPTQTQVADIDNPETWVGHTFAVDGMRLKCKSADKNYSTFDNETAMMGQGFPTDTFKSWWREGRVQEIGTTAEQPKQETPKQETNEPKEPKRLISDEQMDELKERLRKKLRGQLNSGIDPETLGIGIQLAVGHLERGLTKFADFAKRMIEDLGDAIRPYLKSFYNGARDFPGAEKLAEQMTPYEEVRAFDVENFDKARPSSIVETAKEIAAEQEIEKQVEQIKKPTKGNKKEDSTLSDTEQGQLDLFGSPSDTETGTPSESNLKFTEEQRAKVSEWVKGDLLRGLDSGERPFKSVADIRKMAQRAGLDVDMDGRDDVALQEMVEDGLVRAARLIIERGGYGGSKSRTAYEAICRLYDLQPTISRRSDNRVKMQQYSTPLPMAFVADMFAWKPNSRTLEPTAGNGMLVFAIPAKDVVVNELDETRLANLRQQGFEIVLNEDATSAAFTPKAYDSVIANPPFGKAEAKEYDGKSIAGLDEQIALNALSAMKDNGKAAIIIGGNMEYGSNGAINGNKAFWTYLYDHYNVKGVVDMAGKLYAKQGTTYPTRMILIDGRRSEEERAQSTIYPPRKHEALRKAETFEDLYDIVTELTNSNKKTNGNEVLRDKPPISDNNNPQGNVGVSGRSDEPNANDTHEQGGNTGSGSNGAVRPNATAGVQRPASTSGGVGTGQRPARLHGAEENNNGTNGRPTVPNSGTTERPGRETNDGGRVGGKSDGSTERVSNGDVSNNGNAVHGVGLTQPKEQEKRTLTEEKLSYRPHNSAFSLQSVAPAAMVEAMDRNLAEIEEAHGMGIDEFVTNELGYDSVEEMHNALAAEQVDSVAMAIHQMQQGKAVIIGDQTGVGKGRQMAALIRWASKQGKKPIFITKDASLFTDIYRDLVDVGSGDLRPFIFNKYVKKGKGKDTSGEMVDADGNLVYKGASDSTWKKVLASGELPEDCDFAVLSYSQVNTGDMQSRELARADAKEKGKRGNSKKKDETARISPKAPFLRAIAKDNYLFLDESHNAAGDSNTGAFFQSILTGAKGVTFASATFAKRPDTMPLYAMRTAMSEANVQPYELISIIARGGVTLQEIMSRALTESGQMVRRERDMSDVRTDWETIDNPELVQRARENYDKTIVAFNAIIKFQEDYVKPMIDALDAQLSLTASSADVKKGTNKMGVENVPFASKTYNYTKQLMLALKVDAIVDRVEQEIKAGRHPVIALESTMEASIKDYNAGDVIGEPTFSASLLRGLDNCMQYTVKDEDGKESHFRYDPRDLGPDGERAYYELQDFIRQSTSGVFISPLDAIIEKLHERGYKVGELTGRNIYVEREADGSVVVKKRTDKDKKRMQRDFNSGALDVLILNKSASTGISLHASEKFSDQRQRSMIIAQPLSDINDYMQMIGRIDRTGQVHRGYYINLGLPVPAESRFLMMLSTKLKSLNANTTTSQESESSNVEAPDLLNKYGSQVIVEYLRDNPDIYVKMGEPLKKSMGQSLKANELDTYEAPKSDEVARKITGYVALLNTKEQEDFYNDVVRRYTDLIKYLDSTGTNDLKITVMPLKAKTLSKNVSSEGKDPNGNNPFAQNAYVEEVEMDVLRKPMKADEIRKSIEQLNTLQGTGKGHFRTASEEHAAGERALEIAGVVEREEAAKLAAEEERHAAALQSAEAAIAKRREKLSGQQNISEEEKAEKLAEYTAETMQKVNERHEATMNKIRSTTYFMKEGLKRYSVGNTYILPQEGGEDGNASLFTTPAIFCGYKVKDSKLTPSTSFAVFATLDGRRRIEVKFTDNQTNSQIGFLTSSNYAQTQQVTLDNWDSHVPTNTRKKGYIMTGNILQAVSDTQDEATGAYVGQLISYTDEEGNIHDGVLMPDRWQPAMLKTSGVPILARLAQLLRGGSVTSTDGKVTITTNRYGDGELSVPKTKKEGEKYFTNETILSAISGGFWEKRGKFNADIVGEDNIRTVVTELSNMGVRVKADPSTDSDVRFRGEEREREGGEEAAQGDWYDRGSVERIGEFAGYSPKRIAKMNARQEESARNKFRDAAEKLHLSDTITFADTIDDVPGLTDEEREERRNKKGWYSPRTGKIVIILGNHKSMDDVMKSILHEGVAHHGLRQLFGEHFNTFLDNVYRVASPEIRERIYAMAKKHGWDFRTATEEYLAQLAEDTEFEKPENQSWWKQVKAWFIDLLHKIGFNLHDAYDTITDNELRYILWRSYQNLVNPGRYNSVVEDAKDIAKQYDLKVGQWDETWTAAEAEPNATMEFNGRRVPIWATNGRRSDNRADRVERNDRMGSDYNLAADGVAEDAAEYARRRRTADAIKERFPEPLTMRNYKSWEVKNYLAHILGMGGWINDIHRDIPYRFLHPEPTLDDYFKDTKAKFKSIGKVPEDFTGHKLLAAERANMSKWKEMKESGKYEHHQSPLSNSEYLVDRETGDIYRLSDHWGQVASCDWDIDQRHGGKKSGIMQIGKCNISDFAPLNRSGRNNVLNPAYIKALKEATSVAKENYKTFLDNVEMTDAVRRDVEGQITDLDKNLEREIGNFGSDDIRFRDGEEEKYAPKAQAAELYERAMNDGWNQFTEAMQDSMMSVKKLVMSVLEARGEKGKKMRIEDVAGYENPWLAENRLRGSIKNQVFAWQRNYMEPLRKAIYDITGGIKPAYDELMDYMMAKHGLERNEVLAKRDAKKAWEEQNKSEIGNPNYTAAKNAAFANIDAGVDDLYLEQRKKDYAGLTALTGKEGVEEAEKEAQRMVDEFEKRFDTKKLWAATNAATRSSLFTMLECGMMTPARHAEIRDMFQYYIPLQGFDSDVAEDVYAYMGSDGTRLYGTAIRAAKGRKSKADDPIATIAMNGEAAIRRGNRNLMKQHFLRFVQAHPSDLVSINDVWLRKNANGEWEQYFDADLKETDTPEEVARKVREFNERMEQEAAANPDLYKRSRDLPNVPFRVLNTRDMKQHQVMVQVNGKNYLLTVNGNPRAAQALNGLSNPDVFTESVFGKAMNIAQSVTRELSQFYTTRKPSFVLSNFSRDSIYTNLIVGVKEDKKYSRAFHKNWANMNPATMGKLFSEWVNGELRDKILAGTATDTERMFNDFLMYGGETGWISMRDIERQKKDLQKALKQEGNTAAQKWKSFWATVDLANRAVENCARFAAFMTSQQMGRSIERSIWDAKEISVNFEKKGAGDKFLGSKNQTVGGWIGAVIGGWCRGNFAFWNAGVQGISNFYRAAKKKPGKFALRIFAMNFTLGMMAPLISALLGGDDDDENNYFNLPEYKRRNNLCFRFTKHMPWITIPLPIEFRAIYGLGELAMCHMLGKEHFYNGWDCAKAYMQQLSQVLPLDFLEGGGGWHVLLPTYAKPAAEAYANEGWTGLPIYKENKYGQYDELPEWQRAYPNTNMLLVNGTRWINEATVSGNQYTGGNNEDVKGFINWNPARIEYMLRGYLGGYYSMYEHLAKTISTIAGKREFEWRNIPLAHVLITEGDERTAERSIKNEYYKIVDDYENTDHKVSQYDEKAHTEKENEERRQKLNTDKRYLRHEIVDIYKTLIDKLNDTKKNADEEEKKAIEEYQAGLRKEMVDMVHNLESKSKSELEKGDNLGQIDELAEQALGSRYESGDLSVRKAIGSMTAKRIGERYGSQARDSYGSGSALDTEYGKIYEKHRTYTDMAGDIMLNEEIKRATAEKDYARLGVLEDAKKDIADRRDDLNQYITQEGIDNIMEDIRKIRRNALYPEQAASPTDNVEE